MKNKLSLLFSAAVVCASTQIAAANCCGPNFCSYDPCCPSNWYVAASGSVAWHNDSKFTEPGELPGEIVNSSIDYKVGGGAAASLGYRFPLCNCWNLRLEGEFVWRRNSFKNLSIVGGNTVPLKGHSQDIALMANLITDFPLYCNFGGYVGAGLGVSFNHISLRTDEIHDKKNHTLFAWQVLAGLMYDVCPNLAFTTGYRLFATEKTKIPAKPNHIPLTHSIDFGVIVRL